MNPYNRFNLFSSSVTAGLILTGLAASGPTLLEILSRFESNPTSQGLMIAGAVTVMVVFWMAFTEVILPSLFRVNWVRKAILGRYFIEGTWLQSEKGADSSHIAVIDIQPKGKSFTFSGYALDEDLNVNSNVLLELSAFNWPFMTYTYRNSLSDGSDGRRDGVGEVQFEMNQTAARRYNGYSQYIKSDQRIRLEGAKLVRSQDVRNLRTLEGREEIVEKYWDLFFGRQDRRLARRKSPAPVTAVSEVSAAAMSAKLSNRQTRVDLFEPEAGTAQPEPVKAREEKSMPLDLTDRVVAKTELTETSQMKDDRRKGEVERPVDLEESIIPRRRLSDWTSEDEEKSAMNEEMSDISQQKADAGTQNADADASPTDTGPAIVQPVSEEQSSPAKQKRVFDARHVM